MADADEVTRVTNEFKEIAFVVLGTGEIVRVEDVCITEVQESDFHGQKQTMPVTNHEIRDERGRHWRECGGGFAVSSDGAIGKIAMTSKLAESYAAGLRKVQQDTLVEQRCDYRHATDKERDGFGSILGHWALGAMLYGYGFDHVKPMIHILVMNARNRGISLADSVSALEQIIEEEAEKMLRNMNSVIDEQGYAEEIWWSGWEEFKRPPREHCKV